jgi:hypothetical protein
VDHELGNLSHECCCPQFNGMMGENGQTPRYRL